MMQKLRNGIILFLVALFVTTVCALTVNLTTAGKTSVAETTDNARVSSVPSNTFFLNEMKYFMNYTDEDGDVVIEQISVEGFLAISRAQGGRVESNAEITVPLVIVIPDNVQKVDARLFQNLSTVLGFMVGKDMNVIGDDVISALANMSSLKNIGCSEGNANFAVHTDILYAVDGDAKTVLLKPQAMEEELIEIPEGVSEIPETFFQNDAFVKDIVIAGTVTNLSGQPFNGCNLNSLTLSEGIQNLGKQVFAGLSCKKIIIPGTVNVLESETFIDVGEVETIILSEGITELQEASLAGLGGNPHESDVSYLVSLEIPGSLTNGTSQLFSAFAGKRAVGQIKFADNVTQIPAGFCTGQNYLSKIILPSGVRSIGDNAFTAAGISTIDLPESLTEIGASAFSNCWGLKSVDIPSGVTQIKEETFNGCKALEEINLNNADTIGRAAFRDCSLLTSVTSSSGISSLDVWSFLNCKSLRKIILSESITTLPVKVFSGCASLSEINVFELPNLTTIEDYAFDGCSALSGAAVLQDSITTVKNNAFTGCSFTSLSIGAGVTQINGDAFSNNAELADITVSGGNTAFVAESGLVYNIAKTKLIMAANVLTGEITIPEGITELSSGLFAGKNITKLTLPATVKALPSGLCKDCKLLTEVVIGDDVESLGADSFSGCEALSSFNIPDGIELIPTRIFKDTNLSYIDIPESVTSIGYGAFSGTMLKEVSLPQGLTSIGMYAFYKTLLTSVTLPGSLAEVGEHAFGTEKLLLNLAVYSGDSVNAEGVAGLIKCCQNVILPNAECYNNVKNSVQLGAESYRLTHLMSVRYMLSDDVYIEHTRLGNSNDVLEKDATTGEWYLREDKKILSSIDGLNISAYTTEDGKTFNIMNYTAIIGILPRGKQTVVLRAATIDYPELNDVKTQYGTDYIIVGAGFNEKYMLQVFSGTANDGTIIENSTEKPFKAGNYSVSVKLKDGLTFTFGDNSDTVSLIIDKFVQDLSGIKFEGGSVKEDGEAHGLAISGTLPEGVTVTYKYYRNGVEINASDVKTAGEYTVEAIFTLTDVYNYKLSTEKLSAVLSIGNAAVPTPTPDTGDGMSVLTISLIIVGCVAAAGGIAALTTVLVIRKKRSLAAYASDYEDGVTDSDNELDDYADGEDTE